MDMEITNSLEQTKQWRRNQPWYVNGKSNECEKYQKNIIEKLTGIILSKTNLRLNIETFKLLEHKTPLVSLDGFEWTENFDGIQYISNRVLVYNFKMICGNGGSQTRALREVYLFIKTQINYLINNSEKEIYFINILDGDASYKYMKNFLYLKTKLHHMVHKLFIGCLKDFYENFALFPTTNS